MDVFAENFSLTAALKENGAATVEAITKVISEQVSQIDTAVKKGLSPKDYTKAQQYRTALMAAQSIVVLRYHALNK